MNKESQKQKQKQRSKSHTMASKGPGLLQLPPRDATLSSPLSPGIPLSPGHPNRTTNPISSKITSVLSTSYADSEFREALALLDERGISNSAETRRQLRLDVQKEVIDSNGQIISEFGRVADVSWCNNHDNHPPHDEYNRLTRPRAATTADRRHRGQTQQELPRDEEPCHSIS